MRKNIAKVIKAFQAGKAIKGDSKGTCRTDGYNVWSYNMLIAKKFNDNGRDMYVLIDREYGPSKTTRMQIDAIFKELQGKNLHIVREGSILTWDFKFSNTLVYDCQTELIEAEKKRLSNY